MVQPEQYDKRTMRDFLKDIERQSPERFSPPSGGFDMVNLPVIEGISYEEAERLLHSAQDLGYVQTRNDASSGVDRAVIGEITPKGKYVLRDLENELRDEEGENL